MPPSAAAGGQAEFAFQGNYLGGVSQPFLDITGLAIHGQESLPGVGLLTANIEGYDSEARFAAGENLLELRGAPWLNSYWTITGGDFRTPGTLVEFPFNNIFNPDIEGRGIRLQATRGDAEYGFLLGDQTLTAGFRVAYRLVTPQRMLGVSMKRRLSARFESGLRLMQFSASQQAIADNTYLFPPGRTQPTVRTLAWQSLYRPGERMKIYSEVSQPVDMAGRTVTSVLGGFAWEDQAFSFKANYVREGLLYMPLAGYFAGDRQGPFGETRWRPWKMVEFYASASQYRNNLEDNAALPRLTSFSTSAGASALLPGAISAAFTFSTLNFGETNAGPASTTSHNQQLNANLSHTIRRHTLTATWRDIGLDTAASPQRERSWEGGDNFQTRHFSLGGSVRYQQESGIERRNSIFFQGLAQASVWRLTAYGNIEVGNDLANETLFSTNAYRTSVIGVAVRLMHGWNLETEMYRNLLNLTINPESIFVLQNSDALAGISPAAANLAVARQWTFYFRLSKQIQWGAGLPVQKPGQPPVNAAPLMGSIEGVVRSRSTAGVDDVSGVAVTLDGARTAVSGANGRYIFDNVPEGPHEVALALKELPADFDPGIPASSKLVVQPRRAANADFEVLPLLSIAGTLVGSPDVSLGAVVVRMAPGNRYTSTAENGRFHFYNVREGEYAIAIDMQTLPEDTVLTSPPSVKVIARLNAPPPRIEFRLARKSTRKPVRKIEIKH